MMKGNTKADVRKTFTPDERRVWSAAATRLRLVIESPNAARDLDPMPRAQVVTFWRLASRLSNELGDADGAALYQALVEAAEDRGSWTVHAEGAVAANGAERFLDALFLGSERQDLLTGVVAS
jgi:hypothetical protein